MKKSLNALPLLLLGFYFLFKKAFGEVSFLTEMIVLGVILIILGFVIYKKVQTNEISKSRLILLVVAVLLTTGIALQSYLDL